MLESFTVKNISFNVLVPVKYRATSYGISIVRSSISESP
jgi:hypothetical protein